MEYNGILMEDLERFTDLHGMLGHILSNMASWDVIERAVRDFPAVHVIRRKATLRVGGLKTNRFVKNCNWYFNFTGIQFHSQLFIGGHFEYVKHQKLMISPPLEFI